jgi:hypothetical protein
MKVERISSRKNGRPVREPNLPDDFARRVIMKARAERRKRETRRSIATTGVCAVLVAAAIPLTSFMQSWRINLASRETPSLVHSEGQDQSMAEAGVYQIEQETRPDEIGDYLMPNTAELAEFASAYTDASWHYDPSWSDER